MSAGKDSSRSSTDETLHVEKQDTEKHQAASISSTDSPNNIEAKENAPYWDGYLDEEYIDKKHPKLVRNLRYMFFSAYRRLFTLTFVANMSVFVALSATHQANTRNIAYAIVTNFAVSILVRQEYIINLLFDIFTALPKSAPLFIRRTSARIFHFGGHLAHDTSVHSACSISGTIWSILFVAMGTREYIHGLSPISLATLVVSWVILGLLLMILVFAYPTMRNKFHDYFEWTHRFLGWTVVALFWAQVVLFSNDTRKSGENLGQACVRNPSFWLLYAITSSIILPWLRLRKVEVRSVRLSKHASRLYLNYTPYSTGTTIQLTHSPLKEWHGFAAIPEPEPGKDEFSVIVSRAGDWTSNVIDDPPTQLWVRGIPTSGVLRIVPMFRRMILVATGSGVGPCAHAIFEGRTPVRLLWTSPNVRETFGRELVDQILRYAPDTVIYDTRKYGRPDLVKLILKMVKEFDAEAVGVISNQPLTEKVVYGLNSRGIPAYGAIFDS
ncbi:hypothetical protein BDM02DRAFT_3128577 [Thelephora ganbajun]|uniref:Uncharacterized protein n=1 Tax=Thelephora ganbajun TaxID=370292 RepID=A0ACB6ZI08_THEGA|nr:hypothetical protein BDM02DRAFT_3128577 [Thelephora ganbajun]